MRYMFLVAVCSLASCGMQSPSMKNVMASCSTEEKFIDYSACIKNTYERSPDADSVKSFYVLLDGINRDHKNGKVSEFQSRVNAETAYDMTIGAEYERRQAMFKAMSEAGKIMKSTYDDDETRCDGKIGKPFYCD